MRIDCVFFPVGQGVFSFGEVSRNQKKFSWVYDCGTVSLQKLLLPGISHVTGATNNRTLDLAVLSHFDRDHLSGLVQLLRAVRVKTLLLPYIPFPYRALIAAQASGSGSSDFIEFVLDPTGYLSRDFEIETILYVPGRNGDEQRDDGEPEPDGAPTRPDDNRPQADGDTLDAQYELARPHMLNADERQELQRAPAGSRVAFLRPRSGLRLEDKWEFIPYNDFVPSKRVTPAFISGVRGMRSALMATPTAATLAALKTLYVAQFGHSGKMRNIISLFMYAGTVNRSGFHRRSTVEYVGYSPAGSRVLDCVRLPGTGLIYTGDGYLKTAEQLVNFTSALGMARLGRRNILQVMHHGSRSNSHPTVAKFLSPLASIYCSNPADGRYKHPHAEVKQQFARYTPLQVDTKHHVSIRFYV